MDITQTAVVDTAKLHLKDAAGDFLYSDGKPVRIVIYGPGSKPFAAVEDRQTNRAIKRMQDNDGKVSVAPQETRNAEVAEDLAAITVDFENLTYPPAGDARGAPLFQQVYADPKLGFIVKQVQKFITDWGNFKPGSATN
ncbi:hypothetical protein [Sphingomonas sp. CFBP 13720]|uniref:hypothetical protein n=1 Tax=Sphingomonas sp. CFBP 13720 TaxID=2775302 RepID=UPI00177E2D6A|nr:hypothetical protein [Sphingomonas sp. CFBP 13720]MBD8677925.1 hypothetical protein [Sphingomonas sp. CFBP 13720]